MKQLPRGKIGTKLMRLNGVLGWVSQDEWFDHLHKNPQVAKRILEDVWEHGIDYHKEENTYEPPTQ